MGQYRTHVDLFGETVELRTSALMGPEVPVSCFLVTGTAIPDVALIRPFDGLVQFDEAGMLAAVQDVRQRTSPGYHYFFMVAHPLLMLLDLVFAMLRGTGRLLGSLSIFGIFSLAILLMIIFAIVMVLGAMAAVFLYSLPLLFLIYMVKVSYESGCTDGVRKMKAACVGLSEQMARGDGAGPDDGMIIDVMAESVPRAAPALPAPITHNGAAAAQRKQAARGLAIGLVIGLPLAGAITFGPNAMDRLRGSSVAPARTPPVAVSPAPIQKIVGTPAPVRPSPTPEPTTHMGSADLLDTATLMVSGHRLGLAGLRPVELPQAAAAARAYLAQAGSVKCEPVATGGWKCLAMAKSLDVAEVFALSGFAKVAPNAPEAIRNAESSARENRRGVWGAS